MRGGFRLPMFVVVLALLALIVLLASLQYKWLGRISDAERAGMHTALNSRATGFAHDFDLELTRAYALFQIDPQATGNLAARIGTRYERWQTTARYPKMVKDIYVTGLEVGNTLQRFDPATHLLEPVGWPDALAPIRTQISTPREPPSMGAGGTFIVRAMPTPIWDTIPALLIPTPTIVFNQDPSGAHVSMAPGMTYTILLMDRDYITADMLPALAQQHFRQTGDGFDYEVAVVSAADRQVVYHSRGDFSPAPDAPADATVDLFQVRMQDFGSLTTEIRRFTSTMTTIREPRGPPVSIIVEQNGALRSTATAAGAAAARLATSTLAAPRWKLIVKHPSGSLEAAVDSARRRNLIISSRSLL